MNFPVSMQDLQRAQQQGSASKAVTTFPVMLKKLSGEIGNALPKHMNSDRMTRIALTEFRKNPKLGECNPKSVCASIIIASQLGLEPGIGGQAYLVPYKGECQLIPGWRGLVDLAQRSGRCTVWTGAVFEGDDFDYNLGDRPYVKHKQGDQHGNPAFLQYVYAVGRVTGSEYPVVEVWSVKRVTHHRDRFNKVGDKHYSFEHFEMYARKVALLQVLKYMPLSIELSVAVELDHNATAGTQKPSLDDALQGEYVDLSSSTPAESEPETATRAEPEKKAEPTKQADKPAKPDKPSVDLPPEKPRPDNPAPPSDLYVSFKDRINECVSTQDMVLVKKELELKMRDEKYADEREILLDHLSRVMVELNKKEGQPARRPRNIE